MIVEGIELRSLSERYGPLAYPPPYLLKALGEFDLDPCAAPNQPWPSAKNHYAFPEDDGLLLRWHGRVWCNPPYGKETQRWIKRMALHRNGVMLIFGRTDTKAYQNVWRFSDAVFFMEGRVKFFRVDGSPCDGGTAPSTLVAFGEANVESIRKSGLRGALVTKWEFR